MMCGCREPFRCLSCYIVIMEVWIAIGVAFAGMLCINAGRIWRAVDSYKSRKHEDYVSRHTRAITSLRYVGYGLFIVALLLLMFIDGQ